MGDNRQKQDDPGMAERLAAMARPLFVSGISFARTLPGHARDLGERIDMPRRIADTRKWIDAQNFPEKAHRLRAGLVKASQASVAASRKGTAATQAKAGPILKAAGAKAVASTQALTGRTAALSAALGKGWTKIVARRARPSAQKIKTPPVSKATPDTPPPPVPSELMRLLKDEGVAVDGMDVREALPKPVRLDPNAAQGALPLFADEPAPLPPPLAGQEDMKPPVASPPLAARPESISATDRPQAASRWKAIKTLASALFTRTGGKSLLQNRKFQMSFGATIFLVAAGTAAMMMQGGEGNSSVATVPVQTGVMDRAQVETIVRDYILEHPEIIPEAIDRLQAKRMSSVVDRHRAELEKPFAGGFDGAKDGDVVLVEFFDYACGYCKASLPDIERLLAEDKGLKVVYRELPILSDESGQAAKASLYAAKQGQYGRFHRALYAAGRPSKDSIDTAAKKAGLDPAAVASGMSAGDISAEIENNLRLAQALQATGTPTWVVGDQVLSGAVGYDALKDAIDKARTASGAM